MKQMLVNLGTRGSKLALLQANYIKDLLENSNPDLHVEMKVMTTLGDNIQDRSLPDIGGKGLFTAEIETALLNHDIDLAVHSLKDLPSTLPEGLLYAGSPKREDARDAFVSNCRKTIKDIPNGGTIATGSTRRKAQLLHYRKDLNIVDLRGNIDTRLRKLDEGEWDGIIVAAAALHRMELRGRITQYLSPSEFVPSVGQGAIGLEIVENRKEVAQLLHSILHEVTTLECKAERVFLKKIEGGCSVPVGCHAKILNTECYINGFFARTDGQGIIKTSLKGSNTAALKLAEKLSDKFLNADTKELI